MFSGVQYNHWASILVSLGYVAAVMLFCLGFGDTPVARGLASVGRMPLTNYLLETIICTTIFYGHGLGLFGKVQRIGQIAIVLGVWMLLIGLSTWWLRHFRYGPFEWLWRSATYWRWQPMRLTVGGGALVPSPGTPGEG
jgi:uncharacterized protein